MANRDSGVAVVASKMGMLGKQHAGDRLADDLAATNDHHMLASGGKVAAREDLQTAVRRAGQKARAFLRHQADVFGMETIDILEGMDRVEHE